MNFINIILDIVFPRNCLSCGKKGIEICSQCLNNFPEAERESICWIFPLYDYRHPPTKKSILDLKFKGKKNIASIFAEKIYYRILEELADLNVMQNFNRPILIPIPLSQKRLRERGYNQAELICRELVNIDKHLAPPSGGRGEIDILHNTFILENNILIKPEETEHQAKIENREKRLKNIINSFSVNNESKIKNRNIILIDDVTTTGATLDEAKKTLKRAGARKIIAFTIAH